MPKAILLDLDGVLIVTEYETFRFYQEELGKVGIDIPDSAFRFKAGRKSVDFFRNALNDAQRSKISIPDLINRKRDLFNTNIEKFVDKMPGVVEFIMSLKKAGYLLALASQNEKRMVDTAVDWLDIRKYFQVILSLEDIKNKKPDPEIYLLAAKRLGVLPSEAVVVEDSIDGVKAAKNAGMICIGVYHGYMPKGTLKRADFMVKTLQEIPEILGKGV